MAVARCRAAPSDGCSRSAIARVLPLSRGPLMCGIVGRAGVAPGPPLSELIQAMAHRGPDGVGSFSHRGLEGTFELGHARLAIVDLSSAGIQPMPDESGRFVMVFNGEIYNSASFRDRCIARGHTFKSQMDGEVILHLWEDEGLSSLRRLNGIFAVAIIDTETHEIFLARDEFGVKPLHYATTADGSLAFASECRVLDRVVPGQGTDVVALSQFLTFLWVPAPRTPVANHRSLEPGCALHWRDGEARLERWAPRMLPHPDRLRPAPPLTDVAQRVSSAVARQTMADVPLGLMASGGIDSSLIWWAAADHLQSVYSISYPEDRSGERLAEDAAAVALMHQVLGTPVQNVPDEPETLAEPPADDLIADPAYELTRLISRHAPQDGLKVLFSGQGGDEIFGGYRRHRRSRPLWRRCTARRWRARLQAASAGFYKLRLRSTPDDSSELSEPPRCSTATWSFAPAAPLLNAPASWGRTSTRSPMRLFASTTGRSGISCQKASASPGRAWH